jgi:short-subunit dehydrogenase
VSLNRKIPSWAGRRVWVIGASYGIGAALARELINLGAKVALSARTRDLLDAIAEATGDRRAARCHRCRIGQECARIVLDEWGEIDLVMIVAGTHIEMRAHNFHLGRAKKLFDVNVNGVLNCLETVLPMLLEQRRGGIAIVASVAGYRGLPKALIYGATKAALINLAESLYLDLAPRGIGVYLATRDSSTTPSDATERLRDAGPDAGRRSGAADARRHYAAGRFEIHYPKRFTRWLRPLRTLPYPHISAAVRRSPEPDVMDPRVTRLKQFFETLSPASVERGSRPSTRRTRASKTLQRRARMDAIRQVSRACTNRSMHRVS